MFRPANIFRMSFDASSSAWPGAMSAVSCTVNCRFDRCSALGPSPRSILRDVVDADRPVGRRHGQPADLLGVAPLILEHADLDRVLLLPFLVERDPIVAGHRQPQRVADGRHPDAEVGGAPAIDRDVNLRVRDAQAQLRLGEARACAAPPRAPSSTTSVSCFEVRAEDVGRDREAALPLAAAQRVARA